MYNLFHIYDDLDSQYGHTDVEYLGTYSDLSKVDKRIAKELSENKLICVKECLAHDESEWRVYTAVDRFTEVYYLAIKIELDKDVTEGL